MTFDDVNGDGELDVVGQDSSFEELRIWYARPDGRSRYRLRPDVTLSSPEGAFAAFEATADKSGSDAFVPSFVAIDNDGILAATPPGDWERVLELPLFRSGANEPERAGLSRDYTDAGALDLDGDGHLDIALLDRDGWWRVAWGPLTAPGVEVSAPLVQAGRTAVTNPYTTYETRFMIGSWHHFAGGMMPGGLVRASDLDHRARHAQGESIEFGHLPSDAPNSRRWTPRVDRIELVAPHNDMPGGIEIGAQSWQATSRGVLEPLPEGEKLQRLYDPVALDEPDWSKPMDELAEKAPETFDEALWDWAVTLSESASDDARMAWRREDLNDDGINDLLLAMGSADPMRPRTVLRAYLGSGEIDQMPDHRAPFSTLRTRSPFSSTGPVVSDVDGDGDLDTWLFELDAELASPSDQLKAYLQVGVRGLLRVYLWDDRDGYTADRSYSLPMAVKYEVHGNRLPYLREIGPRADFNGDGTLDVVLRVDARSLELWGFEAGRGFGTKPIATIETAEPVSLISTTDVDSDGLADLRIVQSNDAVMVVMPRLR